MFDQNGQQLTSSLRTSPAKIMVGVYGSSPEQTLDAATTVAVV